MYLPAAKNGVKEYRKGMDSKFVGEVECCDDGQMEHNKLKY